MKRRILSILLAAVLLCAVNLPVSAETEIESVSLSLTAPLAGGSYSGPVPATVSIEGGEHFTVSQANWFKGSDQEGPGLAPSSFEDGKHYFAEIRLAPDTGHIFSGSTSVVLEGKGIAVAIENIEVNYSGGELYICTTETLPAYDLWVGSTQVNGDNRDDILGDGKAEYDPLTTTLTLSEPAISGEHNNAMIYSGSGSVTVTGNATIKSDSTSFGISANSSLTIKDADLIISVPGNGISATSLKVQDSSVYSKGAGFGISANKLRVEGAGSLVRGISDGDDTRFDHAGGILAMNIEVGGGTLEGEGKYNGMTAYDSITYSSSHEISEPEDGKVVSSGGICYVGDKDENPVAHAMIRPVLPEVKGVKAHVTGTKLDGGICMVKADSFETFFKDCTAPVSMGVYCLYTEQACANILTTDPVPGTDYYFIVDVHAFDDGDPETLRWAENSVIIDGSEITAENAETEIVELFHSPAGGSLSVTCRYRQKEQVTYTVTEVSETVWTPDSDTDLVITVERGPDNSLCFSCFVSVAVDGTELSAADYEVKEGSTVVTLKAEFLNGLTVGAHTVSVTFDDGRADTSFEIKAPVETNIPQTGVRMTGGVMLILMTIASAAVAGALPWKKKD